MNYDPPRLNYIIVAEGLIHIFKFLSMYEIGG